MALIINEIRLGLDEDDAALLERAAKKLNIRSDDISDIKMVRRAIDARKKQDVHFKCTLKLSLSNKKDEKRFVEFYSEETLLPLSQGSEALPHRPIIVGDGPCGIFCAYILAKHGFKPLVIERGEAMDKREKSVEALMKNGELNENSNVCFGEGGAGAFSDGKLTTRIKDERVKNIIDILLENGAPESIKIAAKPHIGTKNIRKTMVNMRKEAEKLGAEFRFENALVDILGEGRVEAAVIRNKDGEYKEKTKLLILAAGSSARDTFEMLKEKTEMAKKPFAVGVRIEHKREFIDKTQYGNFASHPRLGAAEYRMTAKSGDRGVYTFCMCPGGVVINSSSEKGGICVNGMSEYERNAENSNSAVVVTVRPEDMPKGVLGGIEFQREFERKCFALSGGEGIPACTYSAFLSGEGSFGSIKPSIAPRAAFRDIKKCLPDFVAKGIAEGINSFGKSFKGFDDKDAVLTAIETRTSSPVTIKRNEEFQSESIKGLFPAGEGAGYAGGIVSAAVDGAKIAEYIIRRFKVDY